jgi:hypothetical protein
LADGDQVDEIWRDLVFYLAGGTLRGTQARFLSEDDDLNGIIVDQNEETGNGESRFGQKRLTRTRLNSRPS